MKGEPNVLELRFWSCVKADSACNISQKNLSFKIPRCKSTSKNTTSHFRMKKKEKYLKFFKCYQIIYDLHKNFYQYLLHLEQLKDFFSNLVTLTDHIGQD
ncbi:hypothetical protein BpHYR1_051958 [Brachionus plicatilis]|uniref:Uncharacterized protein n=1 Tax=Brachionus plicatilis TaxID=10195 RepID=A0A3M7SG28_BRAPC|nr:hypothetical protein BpHYR1_051958 [Brachionus plicatilis]